MKKIKIILTYLCLITVLTACGKEGEKTYTKEAIAQMPDTELEEPLEQQSAKNENEDNNDTSENHTTDNSPYKVAQEILDAEWYSGKMQINDMVIQLPISISKLSELGFDYKTSDGFVADYTYEQGERIKLSFYLDGVEAFTAVIHNPLDDFHTISEIVEEANPTIGHLSLNDFMNSNYNNIYYPGGLQIGNSIQTAEERLGTPYECDEHLNHTYGDHKSETFSCVLDIYVNTNNQTIRSIEYTVDVLPAALDVNNFTTMSCAGIQCLADETSHNLFINIMPNATFDNTLSTVQSFFILNEQVYSFSMSVNANKHYHDSITGTTIFSETDEDGITRTLVNNNDSMDYIVNTDNYDFSGHIYIDNITTQGDNTVYSNEQILNTVTEIVKSMQFDLIP